MKTIATFATCILMAGSAAAVEPQAKAAAKPRPAAAVQSPASAASKAADIKVAAADDYRLERESCCGPQ